MRYKNGHIVNRPNIPVSNPTDAMLLSYGWKVYTVNRPTYDPDTEKLVIGTLEETPTEAIQHWDAVALTAQELEQRRISSLNWYDEVEKTKQTLRVEAKARVDKIAEIIEKAQGQQWADDKQKIADDIRNANAKK